MYRGSDITREVKWIIFDEVHYARPRTTGLGRDHHLRAEKRAHGVFIRPRSPTLLQFAQWVTKKLLHGYPTHGGVHRTTGRTPLLHYAFRGEEPLLVVDAERNLHEGNFRL